MAEKDDLHSYRKTAPESEEEWQRFHRAVNRADMMWPVVKPVQAFVVNIKAWLAIVAFLVFMRRTEVIAVLDALSSWLGGSK